MLRDLFIKNFAIIDTIDISFSDGLTVLTGETGTGKSIIINALKLMLGGRCSTDVIKHDQAYAEVGAFFETGPGRKVAKIMEAQGLGPEEGLSLRRIIARDGKNKTFINGHPATLQMMTAVTENLISISGQHAHQTLLKPEHHLAIVDQFAGLNELRCQVAEHYHTILSLIQKLGQLKGKRGRESEERELLLFQQQEIAQAGLFPEEEAALDQERNRLKNAEKLYGTLGKCIERLYGSEGAVVEWLTSIGKEMEDVGKIDPNLRPMGESILSAAYQMEDCAAELRAYTETLSFDPDRLDQVEERLDTIQKLKRKYGETIADIFRYQETIEKKLEALETYSESIAEIEEKLSEQHKIICALATQLSEKRKEGAAGFCAKVQEALGSFKMQGTQFDVLFESVKGESSGFSPYLTMDGKGITETGVDRISFLISPNVGEGLKPLIHIASGGELSRIVLALKAIMADRDDVGTIIFDEVDTGIGGGVAEIVGKKVKEISKHHQVICITHLPQIASFGDHHFKISKRVDQGRTRTRIEPVHGEDRVKEIARMLGGVKISKKTMDHAREMLQ